MPTFTTDQIMFFLLESVLWNGKLLLTVFLKNTKEATFFFFFSFPISFKFLKLISDSGDMLTFSQSLVIRQECLYMLKGTLKSFNQSYTQCNNRSDNVVKIFCNILRVPSQNELRDLGQSVMAFTFKVPEDRLERLRRIS